MDMKAMNPPYGSDSLHISHFAALFGPPSPEAVPVPVDWDEVESWLGLRLPTDYKAVVSAYGPLDIGEFIWLHAPCVQEGRFDYAAWLRDTHRHGRVSCEEAPTREPRVFHPDPGGLLAWGTTRATSNLFWDTSASEDPDEWPVVMFHQDAVYAGVDPWQSYDAALLDVLTTAVRDGLPLPGGGTLGPLPPTAHRTAFLPDPKPWTPPPPRPVVPPERRAALTEGTGLEALTTLVPPPENPYLGEGSWEELYEKLGTRLPAEFVTLMERYGAGTWTGWLDVEPPLQPGRGGFADECLQRLKWLAEFHVDYPQFHPHPAWPAPGGFLPFASTIDGDLVGWLTEGPDPDAWPLIVAPRHADQGPPLPGKLIETLLEWHRGRFSAEGFPRFRGVADQLEYVRFEAWHDQ
ncbi:SMI1/KNR4 family protein [Streptomyces sp. NPDC002577]